MLEKMSAKQMILHNGKTVKSVKRQVAVLVIWLSLVLMLKKFHQHFKYVQHLLTYVSSFVCKFPRSFYIRLKQTRGHSVYACSTYTK